MVSRVPLLTIAISFYNIFAHLLLYARYAVALQLLV